MALSKNIPSKDICLASLLAEETTEELDAETYEKLQGVWKLLLEPAGPTLLFRGEKLEALKVALGSTPADLWPDADSAAITGVGAWLGVLT